MKNVKEAARELIIKKLNEQIEVGSRVSFVDRQGHGATGVVVELYTMMCAIQVTNPAIEDLDVERDFKRPNHALVGTERIRLLPF
jgi:hypothetical protein